MIRIQERQYTLECDKGDGAGALEKEKPEMTNDKYFVELDKEIEAISKLRSQGITLAQGIIGENLTKDDLFFCATLDRCLHLMDGLIPLLKNGIQPVQELYANANG